MSSLAYTRSGAGAPLVLLHGIGLDRRSWDPVLPALARHFDVIAVDLPGFGDSAPAGPGRPRSPGRSRGWPARPNSASPHRTWPGTRLAAGSRWSWPRSARSPRSPCSARPGCGSRDTPHVLPGQPAGHPLARPARRRAALPAGELPAGPDPRPRPDPRPPHPADARYARAAIEAMGTCPGFEAALAATARRRFLATAPIGAPVTLAFGSRDILLLPRNPATWTSFRPRQRQKRCPAAATCRWPTTPPPSPPSSPGPSRRPASPRLCVDASRQGRPGLARGLGRRSGAFPLRGGPGPVDRPVRPPRCGGPHLRHG